MSAVAAPHAGAHAPTEPPATGRLLVAGLAVTQTVGYGVLFYSFAVLLDPMAAHLHTSVAAITGALALATLVGAVAAVPVGRWLDRRGGRGVMTAGSVLAVAAVVGWSQVRTVSELYAVFVVVGLSWAMVLYEPAFAVVVRHVAPSRRSSALLAITIVAGFASSIFLPLTGVLVQWLGWRGALLVLAGALAVTMVPLHAVLVPSQRVIAAAVSSLTPEASRRSAVRDRGFWLLGVAFTAQGAGVTVVAVHLVTYLTRLGHPPAFAASVAGLLGVLSVTGRVLSTGLSRRWSMSAVTASVFGLQAFAALMLPLLGQSKAGAVAGVVMFGLGFGVATIARPSLLAHRYGTVGYASIAGTLALPSALAKAASPLAAALVVGSAGGYPAVMVAVATMCLAAALLLPAAARITYQPPR